MTPQADPHPLLQQLIEKLEKLLLPIGVYVVDAEGTIVYCDEEASQILGADAQGKAMDSYHVDHRVREVLMQRLLDNEVEGRPLQKETLHLKVDGERIHAKDFTRALRDDKGELIGLLCCIMEYTKEERSLRLYESLPIAIYHLDGQGKLLDGNQRLAVLFGYPSVDAMQDLRVRELFVDADQAVEVEEELNARNELIDARAELYKKDESTFFASITAAPVGDAHDTVVGWEGTLTDVTREERYHRQVQEMPIGLYLVKRQNAVEIFEDCNQHFAEICGYDQPGEVVGKLVASVHYSADGYRKFLEKLNSRPDGRIVGERVEIRTTSGEKRIVEVNSRVIRNKAEQAIGRVGAARDVTGEAKKDAWLDLISRDIGNVLHTYQSSLLSLDSTLETLAEYFGERSPTPLPFDAAKALRLLQPSANRLVAALNALIDSGVLPEDGLAEEDWESLRRQREILAGDLPEALPEIHYALLRDATLETRHVLERARGDWLTPDIESEVTSAAADLLHLAAAQTLRGARGRLSEMGYEVRSLRESVVQGAQSDSTQLVLDDVRPTALEVGPLIRNVIAQHREHARSRAIEIRYHPLPPAQADVAVRGRERGLERALGNILHNAIKYSWSRPGKVWVDIRVRLQEGYVVIAIENWGVAVPEDEHELVFTVGFRSRLASDRHRTGTGLGLPDAKRVIENHGGTIKLVSRSQRHEADTDYTRPFVTTVTVRLPIA